MKRNVIYIVIIILALVAILYVMSILLNNLFTSEAILNSEEKQTTNIEYSQETPDLTEYEKFASEDMFQMLSRDHWGHMPLVYRFDEEYPCGYTRKNKINMAFQEIKDATNGTVYFVEGEDYDILIKCFPSPLKTNYEAGYSYETLGEGGIDTIWGNKYVNASINFYPVLDACGYYPFVELHEIMHSLGYGHYDGSCSIMNPYSNCRYIYDNCEKPYIDELLSKDLSSMYSR